MSEHVDQVDAATMAEMREWAENVGYESLLGDEIVSARDMTDTEMLNLVDRQYPGGAASFVQRDDVGHVSMASHGQWT